MTDASTIVSLLTPPGRGALATVAVRGPQAWEIVQTCLTRPIAHTESSPRPWLRQFSSSNGPGEELVVSFPEANEARIHCHGGVAACEAVIAAIAARGAVLVAGNVWQDSLCRLSLRERPVFRGAKDDNLRSAARAFLPHALTERTALVLLDQCQGALTREIACIVDCLRASSQVEARNRISKLLAAASLGLHLTQPWRVVIAGRPNAGKSSLLNALLGFQRSIISPLPGTTRDVVTAVTAFQGWPVELRDTAGLRSSQDSLEAAGVHLAEREIVQADLVLLVIPADEPITDIDRELATAISAQRRAAPMPIVRSKIDRGLPDDRQPDELAVSSLTGVGLEQLTERMATSLVPDVPVPGAAVPHTAELIAELRFAHEALNSGNLAAALRTLIALTEHHVSRRSLRDRRSFPNRKTTI